MKESSEILYPFVVEFFNEYFKVNRTMMNYLFNLNLKLFNKKPSSILLFWFDFKHIQVALSMQHSSGTIFSWLNKIQYNLQIIDEVFMFVCVCWFFDLKSMEKILIMFY